MLASISGFQCQELCILNNWGQCLFSNMIIKIDEWCWNAGCNADFTIREWRLETEAALAWKSTSWQDSQTPNSDGKGQYSLTLMEFRQTSSPRSPRWLRGLCRESEKELWFSEWMTPFWVLRPVSFLYSDSSMQLLFVRMGRVTTFFIANP